MDGDVFPNTIDYWGPAGMVFYRNVQFRWTPFKTDNSHFSIAIERPGNDIDSGNLRLIEGFEDLQVQNDETLPDLTAQYRYGADWGHVQVAGILRKVGFEVRQFPTDRWSSGSETGWGVNVGSSINTIGQDKILLQVVYGEGIASYMNDGGMDLAPTASFDETAVTDVQGRSGAADRHRGVLRPLLVAESGRARSATATRKSTTPTSRTRRPSTRASTRRSTCCIARPRT